MTSIVLATLNARYSHCSFGLRYLYANLKEYQSRALLLEFTIAQNPRDVAASILAQRPALVGLSVYIWNTRQTAELVSILKRLKPDLKVVLGGPEVSFETSSQSICQVADLTIQGEADLLFYEVCRDYFEKGSWPAQKWISGPLPELQSLSLPYEYYSDSDIRDRVIYVEASRGCPYKCEYCLSSLDKSVRAFELDRFLLEMDRLIERGARQFKFVDRTFNLSAATSIRILEFFLERISKGLFLHFEMVPDRLPVELRMLLSKFPPSSIQLEIGIQTWNPEVAKLVSRRLEYQKIRDNFAFLTLETGAHLHADLIAGLPGETVASFADGFDALAELAPHEIQVGILKRLRGTPIVRHDQEWGMIYSEHAPYQVLQTRTMSFDQLQRIGRFAHFWGLIANSGNFKQVLALLHDRSRLRERPSLYAEFEELVDFLSIRHPEGHGVALLRLVESVWIYLTQDRAMDAGRVREALTQDYCSTVKRDVPVFLRVTEYFKKAEASPLARGIPARQRRHRVGHTSEEQSCQVSQG